MRESQHRACRSSRLFSDVRSKSRTETQRLSLGNCRDIAMIGVLPCRTYLTRYTCDTTAFHRRCWTGVLHPLLPRSLHLRRGGRPLITWRYLHTGDVLPMRSGRRKHAPPDTIGAGSPLDRPAFLPAVLVHYRHEL